MECMHNAGFSCMFFETGICFWERKGMHMKNRRYISLVVVLVMMLAIGMTGMASAVDVCGDDIRDHIVPEAYFNPKRRGLTYLLIRGTTEFMIRIANDIPSG